MINNFKSGWKRHETRNVAIKYCLRAKIGYPISNNEFDLDIIKKKNI